MLQAQYSRPHALSVPYSPDLALMIPDTSCAAKLLNDANPPPYPTRYILNLVSETEGIGMVLPVLESVLRLERLPEAPKTLNPQSQGEGICLVLPVQEDLVLLQGLPEA